MAKKKTEEVKPVEKKLYGIVEKVVNSVRDGSIDINHVFTREYASQFGDIEDREVLIKFSHNWYDSLPYILSVPEEERGKEFGTITLADEDYKVHGVEVACYVLKNIFADFMMTGEMFMHPLSNPAGLIPHVLYDPDDLWRGEDYFIYMNGDIHFCARSFHQSQDLNVTTIEQGVDLMKLYEVIQPENADENDEDAEPSIEPLGIYGFMASLIHVMFKDAVRRGIFNADWYDDNWANTVRYTIGQLKFIESSDLPTHLHIPAKFLFSAYLDRSLPVLQQYLYIEDIEFEEDLGYTMRKMLEIELAQSKKLHNSKLWKALPEPVRRMLMQYYALFIKELQKDLDLEVTGMPEIVEEMEKIEEKEVEEKTDAPLFCRITEYAYATGHAQQVEDELRSACESAPKLMKCINTNEAIGYLDTKNLSTATLYKLLNEHFGLKFGQRNLTKYRD